MATVTTAGAGNWSSTTPDAPWPGGTLPSADDAVVINHAVTWDNNSIPRLPATAGTFLSISFGAAGQLICGAQTGATELHATTITAGAIGSSGSIAYSGTACDSLTITCTNLYGCPSGGTNPYGLIKSSTKPFTLNGNATGGAVTNAKGIYINATGNVTINGNLYGGSAEGSDGIILGSSGATVAITATAIKGGSGLQARGVRKAGTSYTVTITSGTICLIEGGTGVDSTGFSNEKVGTTTLTNCNMKDGTGGTAWSGVPPTWDLGATNYYQIADGKLALEVAAGDLAEGVANGTVVGTLVAGYTVNGIACA